MRKSVRMLLAMTAAISITAGNQFGDGPKGNVVYAASLPANTDESAKADFAYEMAQITAKLFAAPSTNVETFKVEYSYAIARVTAKVMPLLPEGQRRDFAYGMAQNTARIMNDSNLNVERAKADFSYEMATLTSKMLAGSSNLASAGAASASGNAAAGSLSSGGSSAALLRNNADIETKAAALPSPPVSAVPEQKPKANPNYIAPEAYNGLINELKHVGNASNRQPDNKVNIDGEVRYHYAQNSGPDLFDRDSSGIRVRLGLDAPLEEDWRLYSMLEGQKKILNYNNFLKPSRLYVAGQTGKTKVTVGSFGYLMAEGNIYDSGFKGVRADFGKPVKYTLGYGQTDETKETLTASARYEDYDYNLEAGVYHYNMAGGKQNTIRTFGGNYNFSNFGVGAMILKSSPQDSGDGTGYVFSVNYGDLKSWRPGTYSIFAKYYNQPRYTFIAHGMNGKGSVMDNGFKGYGVGISYTLAENMVAGTEYYHLSDKDDGSKGNTWWNYVTRYF